MSHDVFRKMLLLRQEVVASQDHGPGKHLANVLTDMAAKVIMWDASSLARELLPELSLHFSRNVARMTPPIHTLQYVVVRPDNEVIDITEQALDAWLIANAGVQREIEVGTAIQAIRKNASHLSQDARKRANRHLTLLSREFNLGS